MQITTQHWRSKKLPGIFTWDPFNLTDPTTGTCVSTCTSQAWDLTWCSLFQECCHQVWPGPGRPPAAFWQPPARGNLPRHPLRHAAPRQPQVHAARHCRPLEGDAPGKPVPARLSPEHPWCVKHDQAELGAGCRDQEELEAADLSVRGLFVSQCLHSSLRWGPQPRADQAPITKYYSGRSDRLLTVQTDMFILPLSSFKGPFNKFTFQVTSRTPPVQLFSSFMATASTGGAATCTTAQWWPPTATSWSSPSTTGSGSSVT